VNLTNRKGYWFKLFVALSILVNAIFGGQMYESACAKAWRMRHYGGFRGLWAVITIWLMNFFERDHCRKSEIAYKRIQSGLNKGRIE